jgi:hypothetical protein
MLDLSVATVFDAVETLMKTNGIGLGPARTESDP